MLGGVLQRRESRARSKEEEDPDAAAEEAPVRLRQLLQGLARRDPHAAHHWVQGDGETSAAGGRTFHWGRRCCGYKQLHLSGHILQVQIFTLTVKMLTGL